MGRNREKMAEVPGGESCVKSCDVRGSFSTGQYIENPPHIPNKIGLYGIKVRFVCHMLGVQITDG